MWKTKQREDGIWMPVGELQLSCCLAQNDPGELLWRMNPRMGLRP